MQTKAQTSARASKLSPKLSFQPYLRWLKQNLFSSVSTSIVTLVCFWLLYEVVVGLFSWAVLDASWQGTDRLACVKEVQGACWPFINAKIGQFTYGNYPIDERWRPDWVFAIGAIGLIWLVLPYARFKKQLGIFMLTTYPIISFVLLSGGMLGLNIVETSQWGGLLVTLVIAVTGIVVSLPLGVLLAMGRMSQMPIVRLFCIGFIEIWRGVPLITVLFMASIMLPLFLPAGMSFDGLLRCLVGVALFASAYMAEVVRGGLQAIPQGQYEAAQALGLNYWQSMRLIILPQALTLSIPGIVNTFIGLFKDTTLVMIVGIFDLLGIVMFHYTDPSWAAPQVPITGFVFAGFVFWIFCFAMSRYSLYTERRLADGKAY